MADGRGTTGFRVLASPDFYRKAFRKIGRAARINAIPGVVILACEGAIIGMYYGCAPCSGAFAGISRLKTSWGYGYSALATAVFGGVLPWAIMVVRKDIAGGPLLVVASLALLVVQWAAIGCVVESLYKLQSVMFGDGVSVGTIVCKVLFDQFVYNPFVGCWLVMVPFHWRYCNFSFELFAKTFTIEFAFVLARGSVTLPSTWSWTSTGVLVDVKHDAAHPNVKSVKDPSVVFSNGLYHVVATVFTSTGYSMVYFNFATPEKASSASWYFLDRNAGFGGYKCAPQLFYFAPQGLWYLIFQSPWPTYSTNKNVGDPKGWSTPKTFFTNMPKNAIDFWTICDDVDCHLFFSDDGGDWFRTSTRKSAFPGGWTGQFTTVLKSQNKLEYFEASWVYRLSTQKLYIAGIEGIGFDGQRYYQTFTAPSLTGQWTPLAREFASSRNVRFQSGTWTKSISHGELIRANTDERMLLNPCNIRFLYQGVDPNVSIVNSFEYD
eukprot:m51a1_g2513 putative beta- -xylanase (492) ;mRNA; r:171259-185920